MKIISGIIGAGPNRGWNIVRIAAAVVLLAAAALKTQQLATEPTLGSSIFESRWFLMLTVEFELFFGLWLLSNILPRATWMAAIGLFGMFTCVSLYKALSGAASCGCFGRVEVNPWYTASLDIAVMASLLRWRPRRLPSPYCGRGAGGEGISVSFARFAVIAVLWLAIGLPAGYAMGSYADTTLSEAGQIIGNGEIVVLEPEKWIGKRFPLLKYVDVGERLKTGKWLVVLYHHDCPKCQNTIRNLLHNNSLKGNNERVVFIEAPPYDETNRQTALLGAAGVSARLAGARDWIVATPTKVWLDNGEVKLVAVGDMSKG